MRARRVRTYVRTYVHTCYVLCKTSIGGVFDLFSDTHASKVQFSVIKYILIEILTSSLNIIYIITKIHVTVGQLCLI